MSTSDAPGSATNFYGMGINTDTFRFQVPTTSTAFKFFAGTTQGFTITSTGGTPVSDIRLKREIEDYDNALDQVCKIKAKKFKLLDIEEPQIGFIAQEVYAVQPELVYIDESSDDKLMSLRYDRFSVLHNEAIKELLGKINTLETRLANIEKLFCDSMNI